MRAGERGARRLAAVGLVAVPLMIFVVPPLLRWSDGYANAEEQFSAMARGEASYLPLWCQLAGAVFLLPAGLGVLGVVSSRARGLRLGWVAAIVGVVTSVAMLVTVGVELAVMFILTEGADKAALVDLALAVNGWLVFTIFLWTALTGIIVTLPLLALALWRAQVVPIVVTALFLLPVLISFVPLPMRAANLLPSFGLLLPCVWMAVRLWGRPASAVPEPSRTAVPQPQS